MSQNQKFSLKTKVISYLILGITIFFLLEICSILILNRFPNLVFDEDKINQNYSEYLKKRDTLLGWDIDINGRGNSRELTNRINVTDTLHQIDFYGDSFTYGAEIDNDEDIWTNLISKKLNLIINNRGVGGYGSDQSFLKFKKNNENNNIVVLNHLSENIIRNVNQFRHLIYPSNYYSFKPRFILKSDSLKLVKIPSIKINEINDFKKTPNKYLKHEYFKIGKNTGIYYKKFPYSITLLKSLLFNWKIKSLRKYYSGYQPFYKREHTSNGLKITELILKKFNLVATKNGQIPIITIIPTYRDFQYYFKYKEFPYKNLKLDIFNDVKLIDFGEEILNIKEKFNINDLRKIYISEKGHMNKTGHIMLAHIFSEYYLKNLVK